MSFSDPEVKRLRQAFASLARGAATRHGCPEPESFWRAANGELPATERRNLIDHMSTCPSCAEDWRLAHHPVAEEGASIEEFPNLRPQPESRWWLAAAAAVLLALAVGPLWRSLAPVDSSEAFRAPGDSLMIQSLLPDDALPRSHCVLRWSAGPFPVSAYNLLISTESFDVLIRQDGLEEPRYQVPPEALERVSPGGKILWRVEAMGPAGRRLVSPTFVQRLE